MIEPVKVECDHCGALVEPSWSFAEGAVRATCPTCEKTSATPVEAAPAVARVRFSIPKPTKPPPFGPVGRTCPKCGLAPVTAAACPRCGLAVERMDGWHEDTQVPEELAEAWAACQAAWTDGALHERVASLALTHSQQPWLARRYRAILRERPDDAVAAERLDRVARIAQAAVLASGIAPRASSFSRGSSTVVLIILALAVAGGLLFTMYVKRKSTSEQQPAAREPARRSPAVPVAPWQRTELHDPPPPRPDPPTKGNPNPDATPEPAPPPRVESSPPP